MIRSEDYEDKAKMTTDPWHREVRSEVFRKSAT